MEASEFPIKLTTSNGRTILEFIHKTLGHVADIAISTSSLLEEKAKIGATKIAPEIIVQSSGSICVVTKSLDEWEFKPGTQVSYTPTPPTFTFQESNPPFNSQVEFVLDV